MLAHASTDWFMKLVLADPSISDVREAFPILMFRKRLEDFPAVNAIGDIARVYGVGVRAVAAARTPACAARVTTHVRACSLSERNAV